MIRARNETSAKGVVSAGDIQSAQAGAEMLRLGGNAADAAVAAGFAAFVCEVALCGPLGGGVAVSQFGNAKPDAWDFFARVPGLGHTLDDTLEFGTAIIDFGVTQQTFRVGRGAASLGLALPGLIELQKAHGILPLSEVVAPAVALGRDGYEVGDQMSYILSLIEPIFKWTDTSHRLCFPAGVPPRVGTVLTNADLANVLESIGKDPKTAAAIYDQFAREFGPSEGGLITPADLRELSVSRQAAIKFHWKDWEIASMPAPSSGGVLIGVGARLLTGMGERHRFGSVEHYLELANVQRQLLKLRTNAFDDQIEDPKYVDYLLKTLSVDELKTLIAGEMPDNILGSTTHISAMDGEQNVVSMTLTNGEGCGCVLTDCGIQVNNLLGEEDINPKGFHQAEPGTRMHTMMAPTIGGNQYRRIALGSGGSNRLRNAILATLLNVIEYDLSLEAAVHQPRLHVDRTSAGVGVNVEASSIPEPLIQNLEREFDSVTAFPSFNMFFGGVHAVESSSGVFGGVGDRRRGGRTVRLE